jgi:outer membrane receptor protein involved in Fe transport
MPRCAVLPVLALLARPAAAQGDTSRVPTLDPIVVTAERTPSALRSSTTSVSRISAAELARTPHATLADVLRRVPGFALVDFDGLGFDPQLMVRGFYGGGEVEYVVALVDGKPVAQVQTGLVPWGALPPLSTIESIEIVRGSTSALYGDAAIGGVINVITRREGQGAPLRGEGAGGTFGSWTASLGATAGIGGHDATASAGFDHTDGFRAHSARDAARLQASATLLATAATRLALSVRSYSRSFDEPGPLLDSLLAQNRSASDPLFRFDHTRDVSGTLLLDGDHTLGASTRLSASLSGEWCQTVAVRTLALAPGFGDTQEQHADNTRAAGTVQLDIPRSPLPGLGHLVLGGELARGTLDSKYYGVATGDRDAYRAATGARGAQDAGGTASRLTGAMFEQYIVPLADPVRLSLGARLDWLGDEFQPGAGSPEVTSSHTAFSPKVGLNVRYARRAHGAGNVYLSASSSFKAPTLNQLFDQRPIPVPFAPYTITTSNAQLSPERGSNIEAGLYHTEEVAGSLRASASVSVYQMEMRNELDFDVQALRYVNIGRSRHRGVETGITLSAFNATSLFANYTLQAATSQSGANAGKYLKAIPRHTVSGGITVTPWSALETGVIITHMRGAPLDDANTRSLAPTTRVDARVAYTLRPVNAFVEVRNLFDARYNTSGFPDPSGSGAVYYYPAAGRVVSLGLRRGW